MTFQWFAARKIFLPFGRATLRRRPSARSRPRRNDRWIVCALVRRLHDDHRSSVRRAKGTSESPLVDRSRFGGRRSPAHGSARCDAAGFDGGAPIRKEGWKFSAIAMFLERRSTKEHLSMNSDFLETKMIISACLQIVSVISPTASVSALRRRPSGGSLRLQIREKRSTPWATSRWILWLFWPIVSLVQASIVQCSRNRNPLRIIYASIVPHCRAERICRRDFYPSVGTL